MRLPLLTRTLSLHAEPADRFMRFSVVGECNAQDMQRLIPVMLEETERNGFQKAYVDTTSMIGEFRDFERYSLAESFVKHWGPRRRVVVECPPTKLSGSRLFETVAVNRSAQLRIGDRATDLLAWLLAD
jgi:hypothetical protein